jgi:hypothetical protein
VHFRYKSHTFVTQATGKTNCNLYSPTVRLHAELVLEHLGCSGIKLSLKANFETRFSLVRCKG